MESPSKPAPPVGTRSLDEAMALRLLFEGTARETGEAFFRALVQNLARAIGTVGAWVTEYDAERRRLRALAFWMKDRFIPWEAAIDGTPCARVIDGGRLLLYPERVLDIYPDEPDLSKLGAVSYMGVPLEDTDGSILGHLAVLDTRPMPGEPRLLNVFQLFAQRAAAELRRLRAEARVREREEKLTSLVDGAMDAIVEVDEALRVTHVNAAAEKIFAQSSERLLGSDFRRLLAASEAVRFEDFVRALDGGAAGPASMWIPGGLRARTGSGTEFPAEATLSRHHRQEKLFHTLVLRDVNDRLLAEEKIRALTVQASVLQEELRTLGNFGEILGKSEVLRRVLEDVEQVAGTEASVLILGETGTGKELIARAIHARSARRERPMVAVNCAAIPKDLVESELFGHEKGAFTGATARREGRFALADGGTIFLDELGELPPEIQVKLLRVLQEGEFEPVGSSSTRKVDVRVVSATSRDLAAMRKAGTFREDLYYRLSVFPLRLPALRERGEDVVLLAQAFAERFARKMGRTVEPLTESCRHRLLAYDWPGNVRELANVIERAVITARDGRWDLERVIPESDLAPARASAPVPDAPETIRTAQELEELERRNLQRALDAAGWKVAGPQGAAARLGMKPSTLASRIKALGLERPAQ